MAWEKRRNRRYYYRSYRDPITGKVRKEYIGAGAAGEEAARHDAVRRAERAAQRREEQAAEQRYEMARSALLALVQECDTITKAALVEAGYYQHHRGEWRKRHAKKTNKE
jgi:acyl-CoA reductase-like NAD-dependent aldehyde dehydrogenase